MVSERVIRNLKSEFRNSALAKIGLLLVVGILFTAAFAPFIAPHNPTEQRLDQSELPPLGFSETTERTTSQMVEGEIQTVTETVEVTPDVAHPLGTDSLGRDMLSRIIYGARTSLVVGVLGTLLAAFVGVPVGLFAGYHRGRVDDVLMRIADISLAFPSLVLAVALIGLWGRAAINIPDPFVVAGLAPEMPESFVLPITVVIVVGLVNWVWFARVARGEALSFLGVSGANVSWGFDIALGRQYQSTAWWISTMPGLAIVVTVIGLNLVGDWLRDALDPGIEGEGGV